MATLPTHVHHRLAAAAASPDALRRTFLRTRARLRRAARRLRRLRTAFGIDAVAMPAYAAAARKGEDLTRESGSSLNGNGVLYNPDGARARGEGRSTRRIP